MNARARGEQLRVTPAVTAYRLIWTASDGGGFNKTINVNVDFLTDPRRS